MPEKTCDDCVFLKSYPKEDGLRHYCQNLNTTSEPITDLSIAQNCPHYDEDSWIK